MKRFFDIKFLLIAFTLYLCCGVATYGQKKPAYVIFNAKGKKVSYRHMLRKLSKEDIILFGELHNNPISHWLQLELAQDLHPLKPLILGAEMFERDNHEVLSDYLAGNINDKALDSLARLWPNYETDYQPLVEFAKSNEIPFVATNIPRRYASLVYQKGFEGLDSLPAQEKEWIAPLPIAYDAELPGYKSMLDMVEGHDGENLPKAQAIKDATMGHFILESYEPGQLFFHLNGSYHSDNYEGILWYLRQQQPALRYATISTVSQEEVKRLENEHKKKADFIIVVPENMTKTY